MNQSEDAYKKEGMIYKPVISNIKEWPIYRFSRKRDHYRQLVAEDAARHVERDAQENRKSLHDIIEQSMFLERARINNKAWKADKKDEKAFWSDVKQKLIDNEHIVTEGNKIISEEADRALLFDITHRYSDEIAGHFNEGAYQFAKRAIPTIFSFLLNAATPGGSIWQSISHKKLLQDSVRLCGEIETIRSLSTKGTVVLVPTHSSNADSILVGWALHALGVPAFIYGAGLNLFNNKILGYFMHRLGAYKVDRRKKNAIYLECLKSYSTQAMLANCHTLFFPGGTRSRSGHIEKRLKLGLLSTAVEVQRLNCATPPAEHGGKVFIVPCVIGYHFVLEAKSLIKEYLRSTGREQYYLTNDEANSYTRFVQFFWQFASSSSEISLQFGRPMDVFGNMVDANGDSFTADGRKVDVADYFRGKDGSLTRDQQRDTEYTRLLGEKIVERYHAEYQVFSSHLVSFVAFEMLKKKFREMDLYALLRIEEEDRLLPLKDFHATVERVYQRVREMAAAGELHTAEHLYGDTAHVIQHGVKNLGVYHAKRVLKFTKDRQFLTSGDMSLLYFYHNRMEGYGLESLI